MLRKPQKVLQTIEPEKEVQQRKSRFQIVKLEERIAPHHRIDHLHGQGLGRHCQRGCGP